MAVVVLLCVIFVRNLSVENPGKAQLYWNPQSEKEWTSLKMLWAKKTEDISHI